MKSLNEQLAVYQQQHINKINRLLHYIGIPAIILSLLMLFNWVSIDIATQFQISFSWLLLACALIYYFMLNVRLAICATIIMIFVTVIAAWLARPAPTMVSAILFLILFFGGWILQFAGHLIEKQKPAFFLSASQLLIGPLFVLVEMLTALGVKKFVVSE